MFVIDPNACRRAMPLAVSLLALSCAAPAFGQGADKGADQSVASDRKGDAAKRPKLMTAKPTSPNATINLVNLLVSQGVLKEEQAEMLIKQAEDEAYVSRQAAKDASVKADEAAKAATAAASAANPPGTRHVTYVPEVVKRQLREEIKQEVMAKAEKENWASPGKYPEWAQRIRFYGDMRVRYDGSYFPSGNGPYENFNAINTGSPFLEDNPNLKNPYFPPSYDTTQNRQRYRFRARLGLDADIYNGFSAGLRIASGENSSPVSTNQSFGASGGNFSKYALWLDRAYLRYQAWGDDLVVTGGRFDNPFWSPTDLVWYKDIGFDGLAVQGKYQLTEAITPFAVAGAFPIYNTDLNAGVNLETTGVGVPTKFASTDKWLFGGQAGFASRFNPDLDLRLAVAYYDFDGVQGRPSSPCAVFGTSDNCDTDTLRPSFAQKGNTYMGLRTYLFFPDPGGSLNYQFYGLASQYRPVVASGQLDIGTFHPAHIVLDGEYVWNSAFNRRAVGAVAVNNFAGSPDATSGGVFDGGATGWLGRITVGNKEIKHLGDWNFHAGYKYLESDATIDAFVDSDFGLGGTNLKGYFVGGNVGLSDNVWASMRWMSANGIVGAPYAVDVLQVDLNAKF
jgi:hypothetical protein